MKALLADETAGDPISGLKWIHKTPEKVSRALRRRGYRIGKTTVRRLMRSLRYSLRVNRKRLSRRHSADRDRQMRYIRRMREAHFRAGFPIISVNTKKKEMIGLFRNAGPAWRQTPEDVLATDFLSDAMGKAIPYGIYDLRQDAGFMLVGRSHETPEFATQAIRTWWRYVGSHRYPRQRRLLILADGGGGNGSASWRWKRGLQDLANDYGLTITVLHYPTGASKWNPIEHRMFSHISANWRGKPLMSYAVMLKLIRATKTETGFTCRAHQDTTEYPTKVKLTADEINGINLKPHRTRPHWNYTIEPNSRRRTK